METLSHEEVERRFNILQRLNRNYFNETENEVFDRILEEYREILLRDKEQ